MRRFEQYVGYALCTEMTIKLSIYPFVHQYHLQY
ncbi:hypothetical protein V6Z12_A08G207000 [Gossypium hirsutum]